MPRSLRLSTVVILLVAVSTESSPEDHSDIAKSWDTLQKAIQSGITNQKHISFTVVPYPDVLTLQKLNSSTPIKMTSAE